MAKRVIIVGGVAGGMSCAARLKRLDDSIEVTVFEQGTDVSFANCGMPYYVGGVITDRKNLLVQTTQGLKDRYGLDIHVRHRVTRIDRTHRRVEVLDLDSGNSRFQPYDFLVLATGASPFRPNISGVERPNVYMLNNLEDMEGIHRAASTAKSACVVGGGFIGLELVENLRHRGLQVHLVELLDQVMPPMDWEMTQPILQELRINGVEVHLKETVTAIEDQGVRLASGGMIKADLVCLCAGVKPNSSLAAEAGLNLGPRGHIIVDEQMRTNDPAIYAVGDVVETIDLVTGQQINAALAGPANRQGRIVADVLAGRESTYRQTQATAIVKVFNQAAASTGVSEKRLKALGLPYHRVYVHPTSHPRYYPDAQPVSIKLLFSPQGKIYGAQVIGAEGVDGIINTLATAQRAGMTVHDLEHLELAYSPQWGGAKHPINMAGFVAANILKGDVQVVESDELPEEAFILDCRTSEESEVGILPGSVSVPLDELRQRFHDLPRDREIVTYCAVGLRGYIAARYLAQQGFRVRNLNGGYRTWCWFQTLPSGPIHAPSYSAESETDPTSPQPKGEVLKPSLQPIQLDVCGLQCPGPMVQVKQAIDRMTPGQVLEVTATDPGFAADIPMWCSRTGNTLLEVKTQGKGYLARIVKAQPHPGVSPAPVPAARQNGKTLICFSNDLDRVLATFVIANGAAAMGNAVTIFFTFWGLNVLRKENPPQVSKGFLDRVFGMIMPKGPNRLKLSKLNMGGMGTAMMKHVMKSKHVDSLPDLIASARAAGVRFVACSMSMDVMGIKAEELIDGVEIAGVTNYLGTADEGNVNLFI